MNRFRLAIYLTSALILSLGAPSARANHAQGHLCRAGLSLGQAEARVFLFGEAFRGPIPAEQVTAIASNMANAAAAITAAEALFPEPFSSFRATRHNASNQLDEIEKYAASAADWSYQRRAAFIANIALSYRNGLAVTYQSARPDAFQHRSNCDSLLFNLCYHFGRATIASSFGSSMYRGSASLYNQIREDGLAIAMDRGVALGDPGHRPFDGHHPKICCTFGTPAAWSAMPSITTSSPPAAFVAGEPILIGIADTATALDPVCRSSEMEVSASSENAPGPGPGLVVVGTWNFGRAGSGSMCTITLTDERGAFGNVMKSCHANESYWKLVGDELVFMHRDGSVTSRLRPKGDGRWEGPYVTHRDVPLQGITHYIARDVVPQAGRHMCDVDTSMMSGEDPFCSSFVERRSEFDWSHHIVNQQIVRGGFQLPANWHFGRFNECSVLARDSKEECASWRTRR